MSQSTTDYDIFKYHESNREINNNHLRKLINSIKFKNLLHLRPILVDAQMRLIDGQHRLQAARELHIPIFYEVDKKADSHDIILLNNNQKTWRREDYCNFHANEGNENYIKFRAFCLKKQITISDGLIFFGVAGGHKNDEFKSGKFKFLSEFMDEYEENVLKVKHVLSFLERKLIGNKKFIYRGMFTKGLISLFNNKSFDFEVFMKKIELRLDWVHSCSCLQHYREMFTAIYNFRNSNPILPNKESNNEI